MHDIQEMKTRLESVNCAFKKVLFENNELKRFVAWNKAKLVDQEFENENLVQENRRLNAMLSVERSRNKTVVPDIVGGHKEVVIGEQEYSAALLALSRLSQGDDLRHSFGMFIQFNHYLDDTYLYNSLFVLYCIRWSAQLQWAH